MTDPATTIATPTVATLATTAAATALSAWGSYAIVLIVLGWMLWRSHQDRTKLEATNAELRTENAALRDKRLEDAQKMIGVTESSTALQQARTQGDQLFLTAIQDIAAEMAAMRASQDGTSDSRQLVEQLTTLVERNRLSRSDGSRRPSRDRGSR